MAALIDADVNIYRSGALSSIARIVQENTKKITSRFISLTIMASLL